MVTRCGRLHGDAIKSPQRQACQQSTPPDGAATAAARSTLGGRCRDIDGHRLLGSQSADRILAAKRVVLCGPTAQEPGWMAQSGSGRLAGRGA
jgi:hypothetical protein